MSINPFSLEGKTILVTGASSGIGRSIAVACSQMGATVVINGRNESKLDETLTLMLAGAHQKVVGDLTGDLTSLVNQMPKFDGIVHCAGIGHSKLCKQIEAEDIDLVMGVNFKAPVLLQAELLKQRKVNKGASIVFVASLGYDYPNVANGVYCASKGAIVSYANCLKLELAPRLIRVNVISPGMVWTDLIVHGGMTEESLREDEQNNYLFHQYNQPEDIAYLAVYLLSDATVRMTGTNVHIAAGAKRF
ncbi:MAG: SDR family oxidoreductase [Muribaculaceae bacterium]|nr:SDR family oxidoreductase [Muribaculaceae bacterium]